MTHITTSFNLEMNIKHLTVLVSLGLWEAIASTSDCAKVVATWTQCGGTAPSFNLTDPQACCIHDESVFDISDISGIICAADKTTVTGL
jgi:hypothetical protein